MSRAYRSTATGAVLSLLCGLLPPVQQAGAEDLITAVSSNTIAIESNFVGAEIVLFGSIERDAATVARRQGYDIVVVARGPSHTVTTWQKERVAGIWVNRDSRTYINAPSYLAVLSNRPLDGIADPLVLTRYQLGLDRIILLEPGTAAGVPAPQGKPFHQAIVRLMRQRNLYVSDPYGVQFLSPSLFLAHIPLPANVPVGRYRADVYLFGDSALLEQATVDISIRKSGFEQIMTLLATNHSALYGLGAVAIAIFSGWFAGLIFRRE